LRGCERKVILLKGTASQMFDEAYFLLRPDFERRGQEEMLHEAIRIVDRNTTRRRRRRVTGRDAVSFALGIAIGAALMFFLRWI